MEQSMGETSIRPLLLEPVNQYLSYRNTFKERLSGQSDFPEWGKNWFSAKQETRYHCKGNGEAASKMSYLRQIAPKTGKKRVKNNLKLIAALLLLFVAPCALIAWGLALLINDFFAIFLF